MSIRKLSSNLVPMSIQRIQAHLNLSHWNWLTNCRELLAWFLATGKSSITKLVGQIRVVLRTHIKARTIAAATGFF